MGLHHDHQSSHSRAVDLVQEGLEHICGPDRRGRNRETDESPAEDNTHEGAAAEAQGPERQPEVDVIMTTRLSFRIYIIKLGSSFIRSLIVSNECNGIK